MSQIHQIVRVNVPTSELLAMSVNIVTSQILLIKEYNNSVISMAHHCASQTEGYVFPLARVDVNHTVADTIVSNLFV